MEAVVNRLAELAPIEPGEARLRVRWLGRVHYRDALALQRGLLSSDGQYLLLLEHRSVYTLGVRADPAHVLVDPEAVGAELVRADRGGDVTYHGPGQLVGYPILDVPMGPRAIPSYVATLETLVLEALTSCGLAGAGRLAGYPGVWVDPEGPAPRKICAIGVRVTRGRSMHGFALNVAPDLAMFGHIVPCGIADKGVTSLAAEGITVTMPEVIEAVVAAASRVLSDRGPIERQDAVLAAVSSSPSMWRGVGGGGRGAGEAEDRYDVHLVDHTAGRVDSQGDPFAAGRTRSLDRRLAAAGVDPTAGVPLRSRKPSPLRVQAQMGAAFLELKGMVRDLGLVTVCEEAGCPNIFECWQDGTATFMINGERCTRACGFCLVDTSHPLPLDPSEPQRVGEAVARLGLAHAVITTVARDDLDDGGAAAFAATVAAIRDRSPGTAVELLISDLKGDERSLETVFAARPEVLNHNLETVNRLQRAVRPSASYARSLAVLARARRAGLTVKSGMILGMGESRAEVVGALADLAAVGVEIVTLGQYLRPSAKHLPVARYLDPEEFDELAEVGRGFGFRHVQASPLTRSSYHARSAARASGVQPVRLEATRRLA
jgi:lipoic acid synthetase